jgi:hypothetical protein
VPRVLIPVVRPDGYYLRSDDGEMRLTNFTAEITEDIVHDAGSNDESPKRSFTLSASLEGGDPKIFTVSQDDFVKMRWVTPHLGPRAIIESGHGRTPTRVRAIIQDNSRAISEQTIYNHLGWQEINGEWVFLHAGGGIGRGGDVEDVEVQPPVGMNGVVLPDVFTYSAVADVGCSLDFIEVAPDLVTLPLYAAIWRSILGETDFSIHICGKSGNRKTQLACLMQQHFGPGFSDKHLAASFFDTPNALVEKAHLAKDLILVVDDYVPNSPGQAGRGMREAAQRLFRSLGNRAGRSRLHGAQLRRPTAPRCLLVTTGEDLPDGPSIRGRVLFIRVQEDAIRLNELTASQEAARVGYFASAVARFIQWLAPRYHGLVTGLQDRIEARRADMRQFQAHQRTPDIFANLDIGMELFLEFAVEVGAVTSPKAGELRERLRATFPALAEMQRSIVVEADPPARFLPLLAAAIRSGTAHVAGLRGDAPPHAEAMGWTGDPGSPTPCGERVGWVDGRDLYLDFEVAFGVARRKAEESGVPLAIRPVTLKKRLDDQGILVSRDKPHETLTIRKMIEGRSRSVLHVKASSMSR